MTSDFTLAGKDKLDRKVYLAFIETWQNLMLIKAPAAPFVVLLCGDSAEVESETLRAVSKKLLQAGAVYFVAWGSGCSRFEDIIDECIIESDIESAGSVIMTTAHQNESLQDVLEFVTNAACPAEQYSPVTKTVLVLCVANVNLYNLAAEYFDDEVDQA